MAMPDSTQEEGGSVSSWCGWHTDHGSLTGKSHLIFFPQVCSFHICYGFVSKLIVLVVLSGLTCGLFMRNSAEIPCPDSAAGLYIRTRDNRVVKASSCESQKLPRQV